MRMSPETGRRKKAKRDYYFDNAKFLLIVLVVLAHGLSGLKWDSRAIHTLWTYINIFHMATFIFVSGYFAKGYVKNDTFNIQKLFTYFLLYLFSQIAVTMFEVCVLGEHIKYSLFNARTSLWFLQCLVAWHIFLPFINKLKRNFVLPMALIVGLLVGYDRGADSTWAMQRVMVHFFFFLLGFYCTKEMIYKALSSKLLRILAAVITVGAFVVLYFHSTKIPEQLLFCSFNYFSIPDLGITNVHLMWLARLGFYIGAVVLGGSFLMLVPRKKMPFTKYGRRTLQVYVLHRFLYLAWYKYEWFWIFNSTLGKITLFLLLLCLTVILSTKPFEYPFKLIMSIKIDPLLKKPKEQKED